MVEFKDLVGTQQNLDVAKGDRLLLEWLEAVKNEGKLFFLSYLMRSEMNLSNHQGLLDDGRLVVMGRSKEGKVAPVVVHVAVEPPRRDVATRLRVDLDEYSFEGYMVGCNYAISIEEAARLLHESPAVINSLIPKPLSLNIVRVSCEGDRIDVMELGIFGEVLKHLANDNCSEAMQFQEKLVCRGLENIFAASA